MNAQQWKTTYPNHCTACMGAGGQTFFDESGPDWVGCKNCYEQGLCPRCQSILALHIQDGDEVEYCTECAWPCGQASCPIIEPFDTWSDDEVIDAAVALAFDPDFLMLYEAAWEAAYDL